MSYPDCYAHSSPASKPSVAKGILAVAVLIDMILADKHQAVCPVCTGKSYLRICLGVRHLLGRS
jgi:hypothetical protein